MSSIIESAGRTLASKLPLAGASGAEEKAQDARGGELIKQLATGGLALGGGVGAAVVLVNYLKSMQQEAEIEDESRLNDDTLYIPANEKKAAEVNRWVAPGLALTGGILSAGGAYALTQAVYNYMQKKHRQKLLDEAQNETLTAAGMEAEKSAANMTFTDLVTAFPVAVPLLAAMASGGVAYAALNKTFPVVQPPKSKYPRRIRQVSAGGDVSVHEEEPISKAAADDCEAAAMEFMALLTDSIAMEKGAMCITSDILNRVAREGPTALTKVMKDQGMGALCEVVKGASHSPIDGHTKAAAAAVIFKSARLAPVVASIAAAELIDMLPNLMSICAATGHEQMDKMAGLGALMQLSWIRPGISKSASAMDAASPLLQALLASLQGGGMGGMQETAGGAVNDERDSALTSDVSGSMAEDNEGDDSLQSADDDESQSADDVVDTFMSDPKSAPPPTN